MVQNVYAADVLAGELDRLEREYVVADEDADVTRHWKQLIQTYEVKGKTIHDANIVATMLAFGVNKLLTQNVADFRRYEPQITILPL